MAGLLYTRSVTALGPVPTAMIGAAVPALAAAVAWPVLGEVLSPLGVAAVVMVTGGMVLGVVGAAGREQIQRRGQADADRRGSE